MGVIEVFFALKRLLHPEINTVKFENGFVLACHSKDKRKKAIFEFYGVSFRDERVVLEQKYTLMTPI